MVKGLYHFIRETWKKPDRKLLHEKMIEWRKQPVVFKLENPTRLDRARNLGYKAKKGFVIVRVRVKRGGHKRTRPHKGRKIKNLTIRKNLSVNYRWISEQRAQKKYKNLEVLNSYVVGKDGKHYFYEVILVDPERPEIKKDKKMNWISSKKNKNRVYRGKTSAGKKARGLKGKE